MKLKIETAGLIKPFKKHDQLKNKLLTLIHQSKNQNILSVNNYFSDNIHNLDWSKNSDFNREWVKFILNDLQKHFDECAIDLGYDKINIKRIWFQQYLEGGSHGWHIHGETYTGVYYVEFEKDFPKTELINQFDQNKKIIVDAKEGDIVIFPSFIIHRSPVMKIKKRKTVISFNLEFESTISKQILKKYK
jgi:hypothetical protein